MTKHEPEHKWVAFLAGGIPSFFPDRERAEAWAEDRLREHEPGTEIAFVSEVVFSVVRAVHLEVWSK